MKLTGNFLVAETLNACTHGMALLVVPFMTYSLFSQERTGLAASRLSLAAFIVSCIFMFGNSTVYHALFYLVAVSPAMQILDHAGIYFLI